MRKKSFLVGVEGIRPAGPPDRCFYCDVKIGKEHRKSCVIRERTVVLRLTIDIVDKVPESWKKSEIEFHLNESSRCADNTITDLNDLLERLNKHDKCLCGIITTKYLREATEDDEKNQHLFVEDSKG